MIQPTIGRIVIYRSKTGRYAVPAMITATKHTLYEPAVEAGAIPALTGNLHVHLTVHTPGTPGERLPDTDPNLGQATPGGTYQEWDIPYSESVDTSPGDSVQAPGTWAWPSHV